MQVLRRLLELREKETEKLREQFLEATGLVGEDDQVRVEVEPTGEYHFAVSLRCKSCGYRVHLCSQQSHHCGIETSFEGINFGLNWVAAIAPLWD